MIQNIRQNVITIASLILGVPTAYFLAISLLKFELGINGPYDTLAPFLGRTGISETLGWNINLLILFGPAVAFALAIYQLLRIKIQFTQNHFLFQFMLKKRWLPLVVVAFSASVLGILFIYLVRENCV